MKKSKKSSLNNKKLFDLQFILNTFYKIINDLDNNKYFTGIILIIINLGTKYISLELSKTQEAYLKYAIGRQILIFSILWMGTRDILISLLFTAIFVALADYLLNENSKYCIIPDKYKEINELLDTNGDGIVSEKEIDDALNILKQAKKQKNKVNNNNEEELIRENFI